MSNTRYKASAKQLFVEIDAEEAEYMPPRKLMLDPQPCALLTCGELFESGDGFVGPLGVYCSTLCEYRARSRSWKR